MKLINTYEQTVLKSKFIGLLYEVNDVNECNQILDDLKKEHHKAKHFPYAYIINNIAKKTDDKEPFNSAGIQIYNQLLKNNLSSHMLIIIRYFGGTKLGASNLLRTYLNVAIKTINRK